jgi:phosphoglucosamine mutase
MASSLRLFGTDGIRDIAGQGNLSPELVLRVGKAVGHLVCTEPELFWPHAEQPEHGKKRIVMMRDTRASGYMIEGALRAGLLSAGTDVLAADVLPTPACSFLVKALDCTCGVVVSASHNPNEYNGIKLFDAEGFKASTSLEERVETIAADEKTTRAISAPAIGNLEELHDAHELYVDDTVACLLDKLDLRGRRIVIDCAHGAVTSVAPQIFGNLGAEVYCINAEPDGTNINVESGAMHPGATSEAVKRMRAEIGFSFDGDGDRVIPVDETGAERDGDYVMAICGRHFKETNRLKANTVVTTVMANLGLELSLNERGIEVVRTRVGDRFVTEEMVRRGAVLGGEQSGHVLFLDRSPTGDGIWTALMVLDIMTETGKTLSELSKCMVKMPQVLINVKVKSKPPLDSLSEVSKAVENAQAQLGDEGRVVLRYSGTEHLARVMVEGSDQESITEIAESIAAAISQALN